MNKTENLTQTPVQAAESVEKPESEYKAMWESLQTNPTATIGMFLIVALIILSLVIWISELLGIQILPFDPNYSDMSKVL